VAYFVTPCARHARDAVAWGAFNGARADSTDGVHGSRHPSRHGDTRAKHHRNSSHPRDAESLHTSDCHQCRVEHAHGYGHHQHSDVDDCGSYDDGSHPDHPDHGGCYR
jgi:hypothetical protein